MARVLQATFFGGASKRLERLDLQETWTDLRRILTSFDLQARRSAKAAEVRRALNEGFRASTAWVKARGHVDWLKYVKRGEVTLSIAVESRFSGHPDLLLVNVARLRDEITRGKVDIGVLVVGSDSLAKTSARRLLSSSDALRAVRRIRAEDSPIVVLGLELWDTENTIRP